MARSRRFIILLILCSPVFAQTKPSSTRTPRKDTKKAPDVFWSHQYDSVRGVNDGTLKLCNISKNPASLCMSISAYWNSAKTEDKPETHRDDTVNVYLLLLEHESDKVLRPQSDAILLLDKALRVYLKGSPTCLAPECDLTDLRNQSVLPFVLADMARASTVEGAADDLSFSLSTEQIAAIRDFCANRYLPDFFSMDDALNGATAMETIKRMDAEYRSVSETQSLNDRGETWKTTEIVSATSEGLSAKSVRFYSHGFSHATTYSSQIKWKDIKLMDCRGDFQCRSGDCSANHIEHPGYPDHDHNDDAQFFFDPMGNQGQFLMAYIYYRRSFRKDSLMYFGS